MTLRLTKLSPQGFPGLFVAWILVGCLMLVAGGELLAAYCGDHCEDHGEESCQGCGDCILCLPSFHMIAWDGADFNQLGSARGWKVPSPSTRIDLNPSDDIDHPPQNLV